MWQAYLGMVCYWVYFIIYQVPGRQTCRIPVVVFSCPLQAFWLTHVALVKSSLFIGLLLRYHGMIWLSSSLIPDTTLVPISQGIFGGNQDESSAFHEAYTICNLLYWLPSGELT